MMSMCRSISGFVAALAGATFLAGCGGGGGGTATGSATFVLANTQSAGARSAVALVARGIGTDAVVPISAIQSLTVTVTQVELQRCDGHDKVHGAGKHETVDVKTDEFDPAAITIEQGGTVRWEWTANGAHTITSGAAGDVDAGSLFNQSGSTPGTVVELTFADLGEFPYFSNTPDDIAAGMSGVVNVVPDDDTTAQEEADEEADDGSHDTPNGGGRVTVFEGTLDVDLINLTALSEVLGNAQIPVGHYCGIIIHLSSPRLVLVADPSTTITDVQLTAHGRMFIKDGFEIADGDDKIILLDFGGLHLVLAGASGKYVLTPQLRADVDAGDTEAEVEGRIKSIDAGGKTFEVTTESGDVFTVQVSDTTVIVTDDDSDDAGADTGATVTLNFGALAVDQEVEVKGTVGAGGQVAADQVTIADASINTVI